MNKINTPSRVLLSDTIWQTPSGSRRFFNADRQRFTVPFNNVDDDIGSNPIVSFPTPLSFSSPFLSFFPSHSRHRMLVPFFVIPSKSPGDPDETHHILCISLWICRRRRLFFNITAIDHPTIKEITQNGDTADEAAGSD